jgi:hypothetical protein
LARAPCSSGRGERSRTLPRAGAGATLAGVRPIEELIDLALGTAQPVFVETLGPRDVLFAQPYQKGADLTAPALFGATRYQLLPREDERTLSVGREPGSDVHLEHAAVSRLHLQLTFLGNGWLVADRSVNGAWHRATRLPAGQTAPLDYRLPVRLGPVAGDARVGLGARPDRRLVANARVAAAVPPAARARAAHGRGPAGGHGGAAAPGGRLARPRVVIDRALLHIG